MYYDLISAHIKRKTISCLHGAIFCKFCLQQDGTLLTVEKHEADYVKQGKLFECKVNSTNCKIYNVSMLAIQTNGIVRKVCNDKQVLKIVEEYNNKNKEQLENQVKKMPKDFKAAFMQVLKACK